MMRAGLYGRVGGEGEPRKILDALGITLAAGAAIPLPVTKAIFGAGATYTLAHMLMLDVLRNVMPNHFTVRTVDFSHGTFLEDQDETGRWENFRVTAASNQWVLDRFLVEQAGAQVIGRWSKLSTARLPGDTQDAVSTLLSQMLDDAFKDLLGPEAPPGQGSVVLGPCRFGPTDVSDVQWSQDYYQGQAVQRAGGERGEYRPFQVGTTTITLSTYPGKFGYAQPATYDLVVTVEPIIVEVVPSMTTLGAGESAELVARVDGAQDERVDWSLDPEGAYRLDVSADGERATVTAARDDLPVAMVRAQSVADRGHLATAPPRVGTASVRPRALRLSPLGACIEPGGSLQIEVETPDIESGGVVLEGGPDGSGGRDFRWTTTAGRVSADGTFRAPAGGTGTATVRAIDRSDPAVAGQVTVRYGTDCESFFTIQASGQGIRTEQSGPAHITGLSLRSACYAQIWLTLVALGDEWENEYRVYNLELDTYLDGGFEEGDVYEILPNYRPDTDLSTQAGMIGSLTGLGRPLTDRLGVAYGGLSLPALFGRDERNDGFLSQGGRMTVVAYDGASVRLAFEMTMIEDKPEGWMGDRSQWSPRRTITVTGTIRHRLQRIERGVPSPNEWACRG